MSQILNRRRFLPIVLVVLTGLISLNAASSVSAADKGKNKSDKGKAKLIKVEGRVNAVNTAAGTVVIGSTTVAVNPGTKIERNDRHVTLAAIRVGDFGQAKMSGTKTLKLESRGP